MCVTIVATFTTIILNDLLYARFLYDRPQTEIDFCLCLRSDGFSKLSDSSKQLICVMIVSVKCSITLCTCSASKCDRVGYIRTRWYTEDDHELV